MERLTDLHYREDSYYMVCSGTCDSYKCAGCDKLSDIVDKLGEYEDAEEAGLLVHLPCKVGDTVYRIWKVEGRKTEITEHIMVDLVYLVQWLPKFGKTVFLTREEAEATLKEEHDGD